MSRYTIAQAAQQLRVSKNSLRRWEAGEKIPKPRRDRNGARFYSEADITAIRNFMDSERGEVA